MFKTNKKIKLFFIVALVFICTLIASNVSAATLYIAGSPVQFGWDKRTPENGKTISKNTGGAIFYPAAIGGNTAYCMDYLKAAPSSGTSMSKVRELETMEKAILLEGKNRGNSTTAIYATQLALWEYYSGVISNNSIQQVGEYPKSGTIAVNKSTFNSAKSMARQIISNASQYSSSYFKSSGNASITLDKSQIDAVIRGDYVYVGPIKATCNSSERISLKLESSQMVLVSSVGSTSSISYVSSGGVFFIKAPVSLGSSKATVKATSTSKIINGYVYSAGGNYQRFAVITEEETKSEGSVSVSWTIKGKIKIVKNDDAGQPLQGAQFTLYDSNQNPVSTKTTNSSGVITFSELSFGTYYVKEISAPTGYKITKDSLVTVKLNEIEKSITFTNRKITGRVSLKKYVEYTGILSKKELVGSGDVVFGIYTSSGQEVATMTTNSSGVAVSPDLGIGSYYVKEKSVNTSYMKINPTKRVSFQITEADDNKTIQLEDFVNEGLTGSLEIYKYGSDNVAISGAKFEIYKPNGGLLTTVTTNAGGKAYVDNLIDGNYTYKEISVPRGYKLDSSVKSFSVTKTNRNVKVNVVNEVQYGRLLINKTQEGNGKPIEGVVFNVYASNKQTVVATLTTNSNGRAEINNLKYGTYYVREVNAPNNVIMNTKEEKIVIGEEAGAQLQYTLNLTNSVIVDCAIRLKKTDTEGNPLSGVRFALYSDAAGRNQIATATTDVNGLALFNKLKEGTYYYKEISTPDGYITTKIKEMQPIVLTQENQIYTETIVNSPIVGKVKLYKKDEENKPVAGAEFDIKNSDGVVVGHLVTDKNGEALSGNLRKGNYTLVETKVPTGYILKTDATAFTINKNEEVVTVTVINEYNKGKLKIKKVDSETKQFIDGAVFEIYKINDNGTTTLVDTIKKYSADGVGTSQEMKNGKYYFVETVAPYGAILDSTHYEFEITDSVKLIERTVENKIKKGQIALVKMGEDGVALAGAKFDLLDSSNKVLETLTTDANGRATSQRYRVGTYYIKETHAPETYVPIDKTIKVEITEDNQVITLQNEIVNKKIKGGIRLIKKDDAGTPISGVEFTIYKNGGTLPVAKITTNEQGIAMTTDLEIGKYYYVETKVPDNLYINSESVDFEINKLGQLIEKEVVNERVKGKLVITKVNSENGTAIEGVVFEIYNSDKQLLGNIYTDIDGIATTENLKDKDGNPIVLYAGTYYYCEVAAPDRFYFDTTVKTFNIRKGNETVEVYIENTPFKLPQTGGAISTDAWIVIIVSSVSTIAYIIGNIIINRRRFA